VCRLECERARTQLLESRRYQYVLAIHGDCPHSNAILDTIAFTDTAFKYTSSDSAPSPHETGGSITYATPTVLSIYTTGSPAAAVNATSLSLDGMLYISKIITTFTETLTTVVVVSATAPSARVSWVPEFDTAARYIEDIAAGVEGLMSIRDPMRTTDAMPPGASSCNVNVGKTTSTTNLSTPVALGMAVVNFDGHDLIFLNTTSPSYVLFNHANASLVFWTAPATPLTLTSHPHLDKVVNEVQRWLPYIEASTILVLAWKSGMVMWKVVGWMRGGFQGLRCWRAQV
jgi:hypothetical protein